MTRLGLLEVDRLDDDLAAEYGSYGQMFARFFDQLVNEGAGDRLNYRFYQVQEGELPKRADECAAYLVTGSRAAVYDSTPWIAALQRWIRRFYAQGAKLLGICFGHQILAHSLGGRTVRHAGGWGVGVQKTTLRSNSGIEQRSTSDSFSLLYSHRDQVIALPRGATLIASSTFCPYAAFRIGRQVLALQGHPEFTRAYLQCLLDRRRDIIGMDAYRDAVASLQLPTDEWRVGRWLIEFMRGQTT